MTWQLHSQVNLNDCLPSARRGASARRARAQRQFTLEVLETRQLLTVSVTETLSASANPAVVGQNVVFTAVVSPSDAGTPTGTVLFQFDTGVPTPVALTDVGGQQEATISTSSLPQGSNLIGATYGGDANYSGNSATMSEQINGATTTSISSSENPATEGNSVTYTAIVATTDAGTPSGNVVFTIDGTPQAPVALADVGGQEEATLNVAAITRGTHPVSATYNGDANFAGSTSSTLVEQVNGATTTTLGSLPNPSTFGSTVTFTAIVVPVTTGTPTGNVVFTVDGTPQAPVALTDVAGQQEATFTTSALAVGSH
ncbi:MAG: Ig-like domain-containing protein, partial [Isosphaeraceae bacterium]|nr:Ig-like domain-containing protein [Isosphaeraceae bacterium]